MRQGMVGGLWVSRDTDATAAKEEIFVNKLQEDYKSRTKLFSKLDFEWKQEVVIQGVFVQKDLHINSI